MQLILMFHLILEAYKNKCRGICDNYARNSRGTEDYVICFEELASNVAIAMPPGEYHCPLSCTIVCIQAVTLIRD